MQLPLFLKAVNLVRHCSVYNSRHQFKSRVPSESFLSASFLATDRLYTWVTWCLVFHWSKRCRLWVNWGTYKEIYPSTFSSALVRNHTYKKAVVLGWPSLVFLDLNLKFQWIRVIMSCSWRLHFTHTMPRLSQKGFHTSSEAIRYELASEAGRHEMRALPPPL